MNIETSQQIVFESINELNETLEQPLPIARGMECPIYNSDNRLDSMSLVALIVNIEQRVEDIFGQSLVLANEKAMSRKHSPFATVGSLTNYIDELLSEATNA